MNKNILVTGGSRGLGLVLTEVLLKKGCDVYSISRTVSDGLDSLKQVYNNKLNVIQFDLSNCGKISDSIFKQAITFDTEIHGVVNNAALAYDDIVTNADIDRLTEMYNVNVISPIILTKYAIRHMLLHNTHGSIVHLSSISVHTGYKGLSMYASSKGALEAFSKNTAREWGERGIRSNCLVAGFMETDMSSKLTDDQRKRIYKRTSLKRETSIQSVANTIAFLLSDEASSITGENIHVDNGTI